MTVPTILYLQNVFDILSWRWKQQVHQTVGTYIPNYTASHPKNITIVMVPYTLIVAEQANTLRTL